MHAKEEGSSSSKNKYTNHIIRIMAINISSLFYLRGNEKWETQYHHHDHDLIIKEKLSGSLAEVRFNFSCEMSLSITETWESSQGEFSRGRRNEREPTINPLEWNVAQFSFKLSF